MTASKLSLPIPAVARVARITARTSRRLLLPILIVGLQTIVNPASAATTGTVFKPFYDFIYEAATGYLGRGIAITGGVIGLGTGAALGRPLLAAVGIVLAIFGALGPTIADAIYNTAIV